MRQFFYDFQIDGKPILVPDSDITVEFSDLDDSDSGRDESGVMHRIVLRKNIKKIPLTYSFLTNDEYRYMESLFGGKAEFVVNCRDSDGYPITFTAYRSSHKITIHNIRKGLHKNYGFNIIEC